MDILTHSLTGLAAGTILVNFSKHGFFEKVPIVFFSTLGGIFPDIDALSLWSKFDSTIGSFLNLKNTGQFIYFSKFWYSHHAFFHSLAAALIFAIFFMSLLFFLRIITGTQKTYITFWQEYYLIGVAFFSGYFLHLMADLPTPGAYWGGIQFFWPFKIYIGGFGKIWWWNNYDIFIFVILCILFNTIIYISGGYFKINRKLISSIVGVLCFTALVYQIYNRKFNFNYPAKDFSFEKYEEKSKQIQKEILGESTYNFMRYVDHKLFIQF